MKPKPPSRRRPTETQTHTQPQPPPHTQTETQAQAQTCTVLWTPGHTLRPFGRRRMRLERRLVWGVAVGMAGNTCRAVYMLSCMPPLPPGFVLVIFFNTRAWIFLS